LNYVTKELEDQINSRVVKTTEYVKDFLTYGQNPIVAESDIVTKTQLETHIRQLLAKWLNRFYSNEYRTILVPGQIKSTYDPFIVKAMLRLHDRNEHPTFARIREINVDGMPLLKEQLIWNTIIDGQNTLVPITAQKLVLISTTVFNSYPIYDGIYHSGIGLVAYPFKIDDTVDGEYVDDSGIPSQSPFTNPDVADYFNLDLLNLDLDGYHFSLDSSEDFLLDSSAADHMLDGVPYIHPANQDDFYVFTEAFYTEAPTGQSLLELLVQDMITGNAINTTKLNLLCNDVNNWGRLEKFYYTPVLIALLKVALRKL
jgi:hypothetical protein